MYTYVTRLYSCEHQTMSVVINGTLNIIFSLTGGQDFGQLSALYVNGRHVIILSHKIQLMLFIVATRRDLIKGLYGACYKRHTADKNLLIMSGRQSDFLTVGLSIDRSLFKWVGIEVVLPWALVSFPPNRHNLCIIMFNIFFYCHAFIFCKHCLDFFSAYL